MAKPAEQHIVIIAPERFAIDGDMRALVDISAPFRASVNKVEASHSKKPTNARYLPSANLSRYI